MRSILIYSNLYIALAAVAMTMETQVQIGLLPQWHPYLFLIFFATLFEYNLHRFITILINPEAINSEKHQWVKGKLPLFYALVICSVLGFIIAVLQAKLSVLMTLAPIAGLTLFYSTPLSRTLNGIFRLRQIPYLKIFLIAFVWAVVTILLPVIHAEISFSWMHIGTMIAERFLFVFAITIPFDIRDMEADSSSGLKTIPLKIGARKSRRLAIAVLIFFGLISLIHYSYTEQWAVLVAVLLSFVTTLIFLINREMRQWPLYYYGVLDGTMLLQGIFVIGLHFLF